MLENEQLVVGWRGALLSAGSSFAPSVASAEGKDDPCSRPALHLGRPALHLGWGRQHAITTSPKRHLDITYSIQIREALRERGAVAPLSCSVVRPGDG